VHLSLLHTISITNERKDDWGGGSSFVIEKNKMEGIDWGSENRGKDYSNSKLSSLQLGNNDAYQIARD
jgi:hypothetical protein